MEATKEKMVDLKPKAKKITDEQLVKLKEVINNNNMIQFKIGALETQKHELVHKHAQIQGQIIELQDQFSKEYGTFDVNVDDGTINYSDDEAPLD